MCWILVGFIEGDVFVFLHCVLLYFGVCCVCILGCILVFNFFGFVFFIILLLLLSLLYTYIYIYIFFFLIIFFTNLIKI